MGDRTALIERWLRLAEPNRFSHVPDTPATRRKRRRKRRRNRGEYLRDRWGPRDYTDLEPYKD